VHCLVLTLRVPTGRHTCVPTPWQSMLLGQEADRLAKQVSSWPRASFATGPNYWW